MYISNSDDTSYNNVSITNNNHETNRIVELLPPRVIHYSNFSTDLVIGIIKQMYNHVILIGYINMLQELLVLLLLLLELYTMIILFVPIIIT